MLAAALVAVLAAGPVKLGCPGFTCEGLSPALCEAYVDRFVTVLGGDGKVSVTTQRDMLNLLANERQKQLLGCAEDSTACLTELAGALGADGMLSARVVSTGQGFLVTAKVARANDGSSWVSFTERVASEPEVQAALDSAAQRFRAELTGEARPTSPGRIVLWGGLGLGLAMTVTGAVLFGVSKSWAATLRSDEPQTAEQVKALASSGSTAQPLGVAFMVLGPALALVTGIMLGVGVGASPAVSMTVSSSGFGVAWSGAWP